jgi:hypothetical protein
MTAAFLTDLHVVEIDFNLVPAWDNISTRTLHVASQKSVKYVTEICIWLQKIIRIIRGLFRRCEYAAVSLISIGFRKIYKLRTSGIHKAPAHLAEQEMPPPPPTCSIRTKIYLSYWTPFFWQKAVFRILVMRSGSNFANNCHVAKGPPTGYLRHG